MNIPCRICWTFYDLDEYAPRVLGTCGHTLCTPCIDRCLKALREAFPTFKNLLLKCPFDKAEHLINEKTTAESFPKNFELVELIAEGARHRSSAYIKSKALLQSFQNANECRCRCNNKTKSKTSLKEIAKSRPVSNSNLNFNISQKEIDEFIRQSQLALPDEIGTSNKKRISLHQLEKEIEEEKSLIEQVRKLRSKTEVATDQSRTDGFNSAQKTANLKMSTTPKIDKPEAPSVKSNRKSVRFDLDCNKCDSDDQEMTFPKINPELLEETKAYPPTDSFIAPVLVQPSVDKKQQPDQSLNDSLTLSALKIDQSKQIKNDIPVQSFIKPKHHKTISLPVNDPLTKGAIFTNVINSSPTNFTRQPNVSSLSQALIIPGDRPPNQKPDHQNYNLLDRYCADVNQKELQEYQPIERQTSSEQPSDFFICVVDSKQSPVLIKSSTNCSARNSANPLIGRLLENNPGSPGLRRTVNDRVLRQVETPNMNNKKTECIQNNIIRFDVNPNSFKSMPNSDNNPPVRCSQTPHNLLTQSQIAPAFQQRMSVPFTGVKHDFAKLTLTKDLNQHNGSFASSPNTEADKKRPIQLMTFVNICQSEFQNTMNTSSVNDQSMPTDSKDPQAPVNQQYIRSVNPSPSLPKSNYQMINTSNIVYTDSPVLTQSSFQYTKGQSVSAQNSFFNEQRRLSLHDQRVQPTNADQPLAKPTFGSVLTSKDSNIQSFEAKLNQLKSKISNFALGKDKSPKENVAKRTPRMNDKLLKLN